MAPHPIYDISKIDQTQVTYPKEEIEKINPHRFEFMMLDGVFFYSTENRVIAGYKDIEEDAFWIRGHIPGRPILPGVLMIEAGAQLVSFYAQRSLPQPGFLGFAGVDKVKFRGSVVPGDRLIILGDLIELKPRRCLAETQGWVNDKLVYEGRITGMWL